MSKRSLVALVCASTVLLASFAPVGTDFQQETKEQKVRTLLEVTGAAKASRQMIDLTIEQFRGMPGLPAGFIDKFKELADADELIEQIVPAYMEELDESTIDGALAYFRSDTGKAWVAAQPELLRKATTIGQKWGQNLAAEVLRELGQ